MEYTLTHQKTELSQILQDDNPNGVPNKHFANTKGPRRQTHTRTNWKNAQMTLSAHKRSSTLDTCQNQLAKCPNSTLCSQMVLNGRQTSEPISKMPKQHFMLKREVCPGAHRWTYLILELVSSSRGMFPFHQGKV